MSDAPKVDTIAVNFRRSEQNKNIVSQSKHDTAALPILSSYIKTLLTISRREERERSTAGSHPL